MASDRCDRGIGGIPLLVIVAVVLVLVAVVGTVLIVLMVRGRESSRQALCASNLAQIYRGIHIYRTSFGDGREYPPHVGQKFLTCLKGCDDKAHPAEYKSRAPFRGYEALFQCPATGRSDYRGPQLYVPFDGKSPYPSALGSATPQDHPVACDKAGNHGKKSGNVLRFDGSVRFEEGEEYQEALDATE